MPPPSPTGQRRCLLGPGLEAPEISETLEALAQDPEVSQLILFGSRARGDARPESDLDLLLIAAGSLSQEREKQLRQRARGLLLPLLPVDLDLLISDAATASHWAGSRWHVLGHIHREGVPLDAA
ncbi:MAG: nucleotidyltransferase family protein [Cyanobium sp.]